MHVLRVDAATMRTVALAYVDLTRPGGCPVQRSQTAEEVRQGLLSCKIACSGSNMDETVATTSLSVEAAADGVPEVKVWTRRGGRGGGGRVAGGGMGSARAHTRPKAIWKRKHQRERPSVAQA